MLRTKVEESRRGLMRLQTESRRVSQGPMPLDLSRGGMPSFGGSASNKRASFTPLTGSGTPRPNAHRRISSVSDSSLMFSDHGLLNPSPVAHSFIIPDNASLSSGHPPVSSRRFSGLFTRGAPSEPEIFPDLLSTELTSVRRELQTVKAELEELGHELSESNDARQASEACVEALRDFIAQHNVGVRPVGTEAGPPPRPLTGGKGEETAKPGMGWGFKLWKVDTLMSSSSSHTHAMSPIQPPPQTAEPLSKKIGDFFSSKTSISTASSHPQPLSYAQEPMYNGSDTSSTLAEPVSPVNEGTGNVKEVDI